MPEKKYVKRIGWVMMNSSVHSSSPDYFSRVSEDDCLGKYYKAEGRNEGQHYIDIGLAWCEPVYVEVKDA